MEETISTSCQTCGLRNRNEHSKERSKRKCLDTPFRINEPYLVNFNVNGFSSTATVVLIGVGNPSSPKPNVPIPPPPPWETRSNEEVVDPDAVNRLAAEPFRLLGIVVVIVVPPPEPGMVNGPFGPIPTASPPFPPPALEAINVDPPPPPPLPSDAISIISATANAR